MSEITVKIIDELNDFLPLRKRGILLSCIFKGQPSIKHIVESIGIPHTEIGQIILNQRSIYFNYLVKPGDIVSVYPFSPEHDQISGLFNAGKLYVDPRFVLDNHLGKLATYLRIFGFDSLYDKDYQDALLAKIAAEDSRILITRDRQLLMRKTIRWGYWVRSQHPETQLNEINRRFHLNELISPFHRCLKCNTNLHTIPKDVILHRLEPLTKRYFHDFQICPSCDSIYWKGSHYDHMLKLITRITSNT